MRGHADPRESPPKRTTRQTPGPIPTLSDLRRTTPWVWLHCSGCGRQRPAALVPFMIVWGIDASSDRLRCAVRCTACGTRGATLQHPSWRGTHLGFAPFPAGIAPR